MGYIKMNCPSCGAPVENSSDNEFFFCEYCGTKIVKDKQFIEISTNISIDGIANVESLTERAFLFLEDGEFKKADNYFERVLDIEPQYTRAYIGKLMCSLRIRREDEIANNAYPLTKYDYYKKAVRFAETNEKEMLQKWNEAIKKRIEIEKARKEEELADIQRKIASCEEYIETNKNEHLKNIGKHVFWKVMLLLSICGVIFWTIGTIVVFPFILFDIPFIVWMIFMIRKNIRIKKLTRKYNAAKDELETLTETLDAKKREFERWKLERQ